MFSVRAPAGGYLVNTASVDTTNDLNPDDNSASVVTTVQDPQRATADLSVTKNFDTRVTTGPLFGYEWLVKNNGPDLATNVTLTSVSVTEPTGTGFTLEVWGPQGKCSDGFHCNLGTLERGATVTGTVYVRIPMDGTYTNTVEVSADQRDGDLRNNQATASVNGDTGGAKEVIGPCLQAWFQALPIIKDVFGAADMLILLQKYGFKPELSREDEVCLT